MAVSETAALSVNLEYPSTSTQREIPHLLYKSGAYFLSLAERAYSKATKLPWPLGSLARSLASFASPAVKSVQHQWLALLYFVDEQILTVECVVKFFFPPSSHVLEAINTLGDEFLDIFIDMIESSMDCFSAMIDKFTAADFVLYFLASLLPACMRDHQKKEESFARVPEEANPTQEADRDEVHFVDKFVGVDESTNSGVGRSKEDVLEVERVGKNEEDCQTGKEKQVPVEVHGPEARPSSDAATASVGKSHGVANQSPTVDPVLHLFDSKWIQK